MSTKCLVTTLDGIVNNPNLPVFSPLTEVSGIKVGAVGQYIPLDDYIGDSKANKLIIEFEITLNTAITAYSGRSALFGCRYAMLGVDLEETNAIGNVKQNGSTVNNLFTVGTKSRVKLSAVNGTAIVDDTTYDWTAVSADSTIDNGSLFTLYSGTTPSGNAKAEVFTLHSFKVYDADISTTVPILDLIPCVDRNNKGLFYDKVSGNSLYALNVNQAGSTDLIVVE